MRMGDVVGQTRAAHVKFGGRDIRNCPVFARNKKNESLER